MRLCELNLPVLGSYAESDSNGGCTSAGGGGGASRAARASAAACSSASAASAARLNRAAACFTLFVPSFTRGHERPARALGIRRLLLMCKEHSTREPLVRLRSGFRSRTHQDVARATGEVARRGTGVCGSGVFLREKRDLFTLTARPFRNPKYLHTKIRYATCCTAR